MNENLDRLRKLLAYYGNLDKTTVLALIERAEAAEAAVQRVREVLEKEAFSVQEDGFCADDLVDCDDIRRALDGGEQE